MAERLSAATTTPSRVGDIETSVPRDARVRASSGRDTVLIRSVAATMRQPRISTDLLRNGLVGLTITHGRGTPTKTAQNTVSRTPRRTATRLGPIPLTVQKLPRRTPPPPRRRVGPTCERADQRQYEIPPEGIRIPSVIFRKACDRDLGGLQDQPALRLQTRPVRKSRDQAHGIRMDGGAPRRCSGRSERQRGAGFRGETSRRHDATARRGRDRPS